MDNWLPYQSFTLRSRMNPEEVMARMALMLKPPPGWQLFTGGDGSFYGLTDEYGFWLRRHLDYRNTFRPTLRGTLEKRGTVTFIRCSQRLDTAVLIFIVIWMALLCIAAVATVPLSCPGNCLQAAIPVGSMALLMMMMVLIGYWPEAKRAHTFVREALEADVIEED